MGYLFVSKEDWENSGDVEAMVVEEGTNKDICWVGEAAETRSDWSGLSLQGKHEGLDTHFAHSEKIL